jgi:glycosyltransferase involved in cell wall biosynthesis
VIDGLASVARESTNGRPRVLHAIDSLRTGGAEVFLTRLIKQLGKGGRVDSIVVVADPAAADPALVASLRQDAQALIQLEKRPLYDPRPLRGVLRAIHRHRIDVVQSHLCTANVTSRLAALLMAKPHVTTVHTPPGAAREDSRGRALMDGITAHLSTVLVTPSPMIAQGYVETYRIPPPRFRVVHNAPAAPPPRTGLDRAALRARLSGRDESSPLIACVARVQPEKGIADLIEATALLRASVPEAVVVVAGEGPAMPALTGRISALGLDGAVRLLGHRSDVGDILAVADAFCLPSRHEGLPMSLLEGMNAGLACVSTAVGAIPAVVTDGVNGLLVPPRAPDRLAAALVRVLTDDSLRQELGREARREVHRSYALSTVADQYADIYEELAMTGRRR